MVKYSDQFLDVEKPQYNSFALKSHLSKSKEVLSAKSIRVQSKCLFCSTMAALADLLLYKILLDTAVAAQEELI